MQFITTPNFDLAPGSIIQVRTRYRWLYRIIGRDQQICRGGLAAKPEYQHCCYVLLV